MAQSSLTRIGAYALIIICISHPILFLEDIMLEAPRWASGLLWSTRHLEPFSMQPDVMAVAGAAFWATIGSSMMPLLLLAALVLKMERNNIPIPVFVPMTLLIWSLAGSLIMEPSGFPLLALVSIMILIGTRASNA